MKRLKVLIVDDDEVVLTVVRAWLAAHGCEVLTHSTPFGTMNLVRVLSPDVILLDVQLPGLPGDALAELLRQSKQGQALKIVFFSGAPAEKLAALTVEHAADGWIQKTNDRLQFLAHFERVVRTTTTNSHVQTTTHD